MKVSRNEKRKRMLEKQRPKVKVPMIAIFLTFVGAMISGILSGTWWAIVLAGLAGGQIGIFINKYRESKRVINKC